MMVQMPRAGQKILSLMDFSPPEIALLAQLARRPRESVTMTEVSELFGVSRPAATQLVLRLCRKGRLRRYRDETDRRVIRVSLTPQTADEVEEAVEQVLSRADRVVDLFGEEKTKQFIRLCGELKECAHQECACPGRGAAADSFRAPKEETAV